jgi:hypothetical protein
LHLGSWPAGCWLLACWPARGRGRTKSQKPKSKSATTPLCWQEGIKTSHALEEAPAPAGW